MGCWSSKEEISEEEALIQELEAALGFADQSCRDLDLYIRKFASTEEMNRNQYYLIGERLNLTLQNSAKARSAETYLGDLLFYKGSYNRTRLLVLAIMHGSAENPDVRARLIFEIFDTELTDSISMTSVEFLSSVMSNIALEEVQLLVNYEELSKTGAARLKEYVDNLQSMAPGMPKRLMKELFKGEGICELNTLLEAIRDPEIARLMTPAGIRRFAMKLKKDEIGSAKLKK